VRAGTPRSRASRRGLAIAIGALWLLAFEVAPWLHIALHDQLAPHTHVIDGMIVTVSFAGGTHVHADGSVHRDGEPETDATPRRRSTDGRRHVKTPLGHGAGSFAHHGVAVTAPPPVITHPRAVTRAVTRVATRFEGAAISRSCGRAVARGPPSAAA
jgi:hypothetical protein